MHMPKNIVADFRLSRRSNVDMNLVCERWYRVEAGCIFYVSMIFSVSTFKAM
jgi:hypothetical protein